jgi:predicted ATP-grasp superfamily ATP-dependent carboligase
VNLEQSDKRAAPAAVVVGLCGHGLAVTKALGKSGIETYALESNQRRPGVHTRHARVLPCADINGKGLLDALRSIRRRFDEAPVLFLTNDRMVRNVAEGWESLRSEYLLSWHACRQPIVALLDKSNLEARCKAVGLSYPASRLVANEADVAAVGAELEFPIVVKPVRPLGRFKVLRLQSVEELRRIVERHDSDLPFLVQRCIEGGDEALSFCALYLAGGKEVARFDGRKIRSFPPALGGTVAAESNPDPEVHAATRTFFDGLSLSGPVSLEVKRDAAGRLWVIEPTVGRTDFWVALCIANGVNLPAIEYREVVGSSSETRTQDDRYRWFDTERDPLCYARYMLSSKRGKWRSAVFPYLDWTDPRPLLAAVGVSIGSLASRAMRRLRDGVRLRAVRAEP